MKLSALRLYNVKRFAGRGVAIEGIGDGVNVLCAANEYGKSTSFEALHALFFQQHTGAPREVRRMQPYSGGNPLIEVDIATAEGRYRLTKQFIGGKRATVTNLDAGRLVAQADEAERFIAGLVRGGTAGPAGLLWVRQGVTGIEERDRKEEAQERQVRESLLTSVQGEVEAITGGRRMAEIIEICTAELDRLVTTTGRPKAAGAYEAAIAAHRRLAAEETRLEAEVTALRDALERRKQALRRMAELEDLDEQAARRKAVESAEQALAAAKAHGEALKLAAAEAALDREHHEQARRAFETFRDALSSAQALAEKLRVATAKYDAAKARRDQLAAELDVAALAVEAAEAQERALREQQDRLETIQRARTAAIALKTLRDSLAAAEALRARIEDAEAELATLAVPEAEIEQLERLDIELTRLQATAEAGLPTLRIVYDDPTGRPLLLDGQPLADGSERAIGQFSRLQMPGIGTLTLRANRSSDSARALEDGRARRRAILDALGVSELAEARRRQASALAKAAELRGLQFQLAQAAPEGLSPLREAVAKQASLVSDAPEAEGDPAAVATVLRAVGEAVSAARAHAHEVRVGQGAAVEALIAAQTAVAALSADIAHAAAVLGPEGARGERQQQLHATLLACEERSDRSATAHQTLVGDAPDLEAAAAALRRARSVEEASQQELSRLRMDLAELNGQIRTRSEDAVEEAWRETADAATAAAERVRSFAAEVEVLNRLRSALQSSRSAARDLYLKPVLTELRPLLGLLFDDVAITFDEKTLLPRSIRRNGQEEEVDRLSGGMREQLSILTRLAFARLLARDSRPAPVILDDALVYSDDDRIERMFDALHRQARGQQIIVFSCRQRAFSKLGGTVLTMAPWEPDQR